MGKLKNDKQEKFCQEYLVDLNGSQAAIRAGYAPKSARVTASQLLAKPNIAARVAELKEARAKKLELSADDVIRRYALITTADPNELTSVVHGACRFCHGIDHLYQHRTEAEFQQNMMDWMNLSDAKRAIVPAPSDEGGFGYRFKRDPHPDCPACEGDGMSKTVIRDTTKLSEAGRLLYAGVKETRNGIEIKMHDQMAALDSLAKHLGIFEKDNEQKNPATGIHALIEAINKRGSKAPIAAQKREDDE